MALAKPRIKLEADCRVSNFYCVNTAQEAGDISYSIVRPTAFFKSIAGQVLVQYIAVVATELSCDIEVLHMCKHSNCIAGTSHRQLLPQVPLWPADWRRSISRFGLLSDSWESMAQGLRHGRRWSL